MSVCRHRLDDPADWGSEPAGDSTLRGLALTVGTVRGRAWVLREPADRLPAGHDPSTTIVVARSIDAGSIELRAGRGLVERIDAH